MRRLTRIPGSEQIVAHSQDGQWLIVRSVVNQNYYSIHIPTNRIRFTADSLYRFTSIQPDNSIFMHRYGQRSNQSGLYRFDLKTGHNQFLVQSRTVIYEAHISPDHERIYFEDPSESLSRMARIKPNGSGYENLFDFDISKFLGWSLDEEWLLFKGGSPNTDGFYVYRMRLDGSATEMIFSSVQEMYILDASPDDRWMLVATIYPYKVYRLNADGSQPHLLLEQPDGMLNWSTDSQWVLFSEYPVEDNNFEYRINRIHVETGEIETVFENNPSYTTQMMPDHEHILFIDPQEETTTYYKLDHDGTNFEEIVQIKSGVRMAGWSPDNKWLYFEDQFSSSPFLFRVHIDGSHKEVVHRTYGQNDFQNVLYDIIPIEEKNWQAYPLLLGGIIMFSMGSVLVWRRGKADS